MWNKVIDLYEAYIGTGMIAGLFLVALIYLFFSEKNKTTRIVFLYMPVMVLALYFCPFFATIVYYFVGEEIYYRLLWLVPIVPVLAYAAVKVISDCKGKKRFFVGAVLGGILILSGKLVYKSPYYSVAQNPYHVPDTVVKLCDAISVEKKPVIAVFPGEFIQYVRQYNALICMPYGREALVESWNLKEELFYLLETNVLEAEKIAECARQKGCRFLIFSGEKEINGDFGDFGYELFDEIDGYVILKDSTF